MKMTDLESACLSPRWRYFPEKWSWGNEMIRSERPSGWICQPVCWSLHQSVVEQSIPTHHLSTDQEQNIHLLTFITEIYIAPVQSYYSDLHTTPSMTKKDSYEVRMKRTRRDPRKQT